MDTMENTDTATPLETARWATRALKRALGFGASRNATPWLRVDEDDDAAVLNVTESTEEWEATTPGREQPAAQFEIELTTGQRFVVTVEEVTR